MTKKPHSHELEQFSRGKFLTRFSDWVVNSLDGEDYAFDFEVRSTGTFIDRDEVRQSPFYVQLKATERFDDGESVWYDFKTEYLTEDCLSSSIPVVLCLYERATDQLHWCVLQAHCWDVLDVEMSEWQSQKTVRVQFDCRPLSETVAKQELLRAVTDAQRRITMRSSIASTRRRTFTHPPGTMLASTDEVRRYKQALVDDAYHLAVAGHPTRALTRAMHVYQLPEDDRPRMEAIGYLLELRDTTVPDIAISKLRLATHGSALAAHLDSPEPQGWFNERIEMVSSYLEEEFVGARYRQIDSGVECLVLELVNQGVGTGMDAIWMARYQDSVGDIEMESAEALAGGDHYEMIESGRDRNPRDDACANGAHEFNGEALREFPRGAVCTRCGLTHNVIERWLGQTVPRVCEECRAIVDELYEECWGLVCEDCVE